MAATALGRAAGARIFRVHDARENALALRLAEEWLAAADAKLHDAQEMAS